MTPRAESLLTDYNSTYELQLDNYVKILIRLFSGEPYRGVGMIFGLVRLRLSATGNNWMNFCMISKLHNSFLQASTNNLN